MHYRWYDYMFIALGGIQFGKIVAYVLVAVCEKLEREGRVRKETEKR